MSLWRTGRREKAKVLFCFKLSSVQFEVVSPLPGQACLSLNNDDAGWEQGSRECSLRLSLSYSQASPLWSGPEPRGEPSPAEPLASLGLASPSLPRIAGHRAGPLLPLHPGRSQACLPGAPVYGGPSAFHCTGQIIEELTFVLYSRFHH